MGPRPGRSHRPAGPVATPASRRSVGRPFSSSVIVVLVVAAGLAACSAGSEATDAGGRPLLPPPDGGAPAESAAVVKRDVSSPSPGESAGVPPMTEYRLAEGLAVAAREAPAYRFTFADDTEARVREVLGVGAVGAFEVEMRGAWYWQRATVDDPIRPDDAPPPPGLPSWDEAEAAFRRILTGFGLEPDEGSFEPFDHPHSRQLSFHPRVGGLEVVGALDTAIGFGEHGRIEFASGYLGTAEVLGTYPLASVGEAFRAADIAFAGGPAPAEPVETTVVDVTEAELVLEVLFPFCDGDDLTLIPSYRLRSDDGIDHGVPAVVRASFADPDDAGDVSCPEEEALHDPAGWRPRDVDRPVSVQAPTRA